MRKVSMATRAELILAIRERYASAGRPEKAKILDEFVALTGFHRKHAMRLLRGGAMSRRRAVPDRGAGYMARQCAPLWCWPGRHRTGFVASGCTPCYRC